MEINDNLNYKSNVKHYNFSKKPKRQAIWTLFVVWIVSFFILLGYKRKTYRINMKGLKRPYLLLCNHMQFLDFMVNSLVNFPRRINNVVSIDGFRINTWLLETVGSFPKRKFTSSISLLKQFDVVVNKYKNVCCIYPEARYCVQGSQSDIDSKRLAKVIKHLGVPVVLHLFKGHHLANPNWATGGKRKLPIQSVIEQIITKEEISLLSIQEIEDILNKKFVYNEYQYQLDNNILITEKNRAEGLQKILYKCPYCGSDFTTYTKNHLISCSKCNVTSDLLPNGLLERKDGDTLFNNIPLWYSYERAEVKKELESGLYHFEIDAKTFTLPHPSKFYDIGVCHIVHDCNGFVVTGNYNGENFRVVKKPSENYGLHAEYKFPYLKNNDIFSLSTRDDTFFFIVEEKDKIRIQKLAIATEELYKLDKEKNK
ncbi:MAG: hypothetical protein LBV58_03365 [Acholeplasmatales bacterium]|jgi:hypothetical protein|nr:hypothetical protein [Acholeplasmatales bacterium]